MNTNEKIAELELWRDIPNYEDYYQVSNFGRIKSLDRKALVFKPQLNKTIPKRIYGHYMCFIPHRGYSLVCLTKNNKSQTLPVHRIVAKVFIPNDLNKSCINHKDCNKSNNHINNLEWVTHKENKEHSGLNGMNARGENQGLSKLNNSQVRVIKRINDMQYKEIAKIFNVHPSTISYIKRGITWKHIQI